MSLLWALPLLALNMFHLALIWSGLLLSPTLEWVHQRLILLLLLLAPTQEVALKAWQPTLHGGLCVLIGLLINIVKRGSVRKDAAAVSPHKIPGRVSHAHGNVKTEIIQN